MREFIYLPNIDTNKRANTVDPDQTAPKEQSDQDPFCLLLVL